MFRYFYNPVSSKLVNAMPKSLSPNILTLFGFFFSLLPFILLFSSFGTRLYNETDKEIQRWFYIVNSFCYFFYRMLSEMDGK